MVLAAIKPTKACNFTLLSVFPSLVQTPVTCPSSGLYRSQSRSLCVYDHSVSPLLLPLEQPRAGLGRRNYAVPTVLILRILWLTFARLSAVACLVWPVRASCVTYPKASADTSPIMTSLSADAVLCRGLLDVAKQE